MRKFSVVISFQNPPPSPCNYWSEVLPSSSIQTDSWRFRRTADGDISVGWCIDSYRREWRMPYLLISAYIAVISGAFLWATVNVCHTGGHPAAVFYFSADQMTVTSGYRCFFCLSLADRVLHPVCLCAGNIRDTLKVGGVVSPGYIP